MVFQNSMGPRKSRCDVLSGPPKDVLPIYVNCEWFCLWSNYFNKGPIDFCLGSYSWMVLFMFALFQ
jgi:hypothetical protein